MNLKNRLLLIGALLTFVPSISFSALEAAAHHGKSTEHAKKGGSNAKAKKSTKKDASKGKKKSMFGFKLGSFGSSLKSKFKSLGTKMSDSVSCIASKGNKPGAALYAMAASGKKLTDASVISAHATPTSHAKKASSHKKK